MTRIYVLHEWDGVAYFQAVDRLVREETGSPPVYREMWVVRQFGLGLLRRRTGLIRKSLRNLLFFLRSFFLKDRVIVLGFAPFDPAMLFWGRLRRRNRVIYHTSWHKWDGSDVPKHTRFLPELVRRKWREFLEDPRVRVVSVLDASREDMRRHYRKDESAFTTIPHAVDRAIFHPPAGGSPTPAPNAPLKVVYLGRLNARKGIDVLAELIAAADPARFRFGVAGEGPEWDRLEPLRDRFQYHGYVDGKRKVAELLRGYDVLVLPSLFEPFGIALIEAMACGVVCVVNSGLFSKDLVIDGRNGLVVERTAAGFLRALEALRDPALRATLREGGYERVKEFELPSVMEKWRRVLGFAPRAGGDASLEVSVPAGRSGPQAGGLT